MLPVRLILYCIKLNNHRRCAIKIKTNQKINKQNKHFTHHITSSMVDWRLAGQSESIHHYHNDPMRIAFPSSIRFYYFTLLQYQYK